MSPRASPPGIVWNSKSGTPEPKEWRDLTQPAFKDKVTTPDPALSGASLDLLIGLQNSMGDRAWQLFDDLKKERHGSQRTQRPGGDAGDAGSESGGVAARWIMSPTAIFSRASR
ncbi:ABC transporter substrate-binding protein [Klebsiella pneumoniae]